MSPKKTCEKWRIITMITTEVLSSEGQPNLNPIYLKVIMDCIRPSDTLNHSKNSEIQQPLDVPSSSQCAKQDVPCLSEDVHTADLVSPSINSTDQQVSCSQCLLLAELNLINLVLCRHVLTQQHLHYFDGLSHFLENCLSNEDQHVSFSAGKCLTSLLQQEFLTPKEISLCLRRLLRQLNDNPNHHVKKDEVELCDGHKNRITPKREKFTCVISVIKRLLFLKKEIREITLQILSEEWSALECVVSQASLEIDEHTALWSIVSLFKALVKLHSDCQCLIHKISHCAPVFLKILNTVKISSFLSLKILEFFNELVALESKLKEKEVTDKIINWILSKGHLKISLSGETTGFGWRVTENSIPDNNSLKQGILFPSSEDLLVKQKVCLLSLTAISSWISKDDYNQERLSSVVPVLYAVPYGLHTAHWIRDVFKAQDDDWIAAMISVLKIHQFLTPRMSREELNAISKDNLNELRSLYNIHQCFHDFLCVICYDHCVLIDLLTSPETDFLKLLVLYLKLISHYWQEFYDFHSERTKLDVDDSVAMAVTSPDVDLSINRNLESPGPRNGSRFSEPSNKRMNFLDDRSLVFDETRLEPKVSDVTNNPCSLEHVGIFNHDRATENELHGNVKDESFSSITGSDNCDISKDNCSFSHSVAHDHSHSNFGSSIIKGYPTISYHVIPGSLQSLAMYCSDSEENEDTERDRLTINCHGNMKCKNVHHNDIISEGVEKNIDADDRGGNISNDDDDDNGDVGGADDDAINDGGVADDDAINDVGVGDDDAINDGGVADDDAINGVGDDDAINDGGVADDDAINDVGVGDDDAINDGGVADDNAINDVGVGDDDAINDGGVADDDAINDVGVADDDAINDGGVADDDAINDVGVGDDDAINDGGVADDDAINDGYSNGDDDAISDGGVADDVAISDGDVADDVAISDGGVADDVAISDGDDDDDNSNGDIVTDDANSAVGTDVGNGDIVTDDAISDVGVADDVGDMNYDDNGGADGEIMTLRVSSGNKEITNLNIQGCLTTDVYCDKNSSNKHNVMMDVCDLTDNRNCNSEEMSISISSLSDKNADNQANSFTDSSLDKTLTVLIQLRLKLEHLVESSVFPYDSRPLVNLIEYCEYLYENT